MTFLLTFQLFNSSTNPPPSCPSASPPHCPRWPLPPK
nr:MAG TPA: hypothetical protein [Caudoviricetes sp.]